jgi:protoporphyrin/coproporphyrin ferrochelatase
MSTVTADSGERVRRLCVVLLQMGGPDTIADIEPFLRNLLNDVLPVPSWLRRPLASFIAHRRAPRVAPLYRELGGGSPLRRNTEAQAQALEVALHARGFDAKVLVAMRYARPRAAEAVAWARRERSDATWVALPLYPQYSFATSRTSIEELQQALTTAEQTRLVTIAGYPTDDGYLTALADCVREGLARFAADERAHVQLLFSAHGLPLSTVRAGDPYPSHVEQTIAGVLTRLSSPPPHHLSYQSRLGPVRWLAPSTVGAVKKLGAAGVKSLLVVPVSFVSDHIETLHELDVQLKAIAGKAGITHFERAPVLGIRPTFIDALAGIIAHALPRASVPDATA